MSERRWRGVARLVFFYFLFFGFRASAAEAATLYFSPSVGSYSVGESLSVGVYVSSADQAMNAAQGLITFPNNLLEVVSVSKSGSIFTFWTQEPSFSNSAGTVQFEGVLFDPGYAGGSGKLITIQFRVKAPGAAVVAFSSGSVLANDGEGTNIVSGLGTARLTLAGEATLQPPSQPSVAGNAPDAPVLSSPTHPEPERWYAKNSVTFQWDLPPGATGVNILGDREVATDPGTKSDGLFSSYTFKNVDDGVWYIHVRLRNAYGWGAASHRRFQIDTEPPTTFTITPVDGQGDRFLFLAEDSLSGISHYDVTFKGPETATDVWTDDGSHRYTPPPLKSGSYTMLVRAVDKAGNFLESSTIFESRDLFVPTITFYPRHLSPGEILTVQGSVATSGITVRVWLEGAGAQRSFDTRSDAAGRFELAEQVRLTDGIYTLWAESVDASGRTSISSEKKALVAGPTQLTLLRKRVFGYASVFVPLVLLCMLFVYLGVLLWHKLREMHRRATCDLAAVRKDSRRAFERLKKATEKQIQILDRLAARRNLTKEERTLLRYLKSNLDIAERFSEREIETLKKAIDE